MAIFLPGGKIAIFTGSDIVGFWENVFRPVREVIGVALPKVEKEIERATEKLDEEQERVLESDAFKAAAIGTAAVIAGPIVLPVLAGAGAAAAGAATAAIPTIVNVLGSVSKVMTAQEQTKQREAELKIAQSTAAQPGSNIVGQLADLLRILFGAPPEATPPLIEPGVVREAAAVNWPLLGLLGVGAYFLLRKMR